MKTILCLSTFCLLVSVVSAQQEGSRDIFLNQVAFYPQGVKQVLFGLGVKARACYVLRAGTHDTMFAAKIDPSENMADDPGAMRAADFSAFKDTGSFIICAGPSFSTSFRIDAHAVDGVARAALKGFYYQRSNMPLEEKYAGIWHRAAGHPDTSVQVHASAATAGRPAGTIISTPGGWYDAGDYNKYIVNSGITLGTLLAAYEDFPTYYDTSTVFIPEHGNGLPDILNEARYNLLWMLTMQDADGGVYHKCTNAAFDGMVMPGVTKATRYVVQKSTAASLDFAAVMAVAARVYKKFPATASWSDTCLRAAKSAWAWTHVHPRLPYDQKFINAQYAPAITTGEYGDASMSDEYLWASSELFVTTRDPSYLGYIRAELGLKPELPSWSAVGMMGYASIIRHEKTLGAEITSLADTMKERVLQFAETLSMQQRNSASRTVMGGSPRDFVWGSNAVAANQGMVLLWAYRLTKNHSYLNAALGNLNYLLGQNLAGYCFVTGLGSHSPMHPHHRPSVADGIIPPVPGLLVGGPNPGQQDHCAYPSRQPEISYADSDCAYASNEIAINWNAPLVYLAGAIEAIMKGK